MGNSIMNRFGRMSLLRHNWPVLTAILSAGVLAQTAPPAPSASGPVTPATAGAGAAPSEAAQRQALGPYRMILRSAAVPSKPKAATAPPTAAATRQSATKPATEPSPPASPVVPESAAATPIATPTVQAVEASTPVVEAAPAAPLTVAAVTQPTPVPAAIAAKTALILIKNDPPALSGPLARESPSGTVRVAFNVNPDGSTSDFKIAASTNRRLNSAVIAAVTKWRYQPIDAVQTTEVEMVFSGE